MVDNSHPKKKFNKTVTFRILAVVAALLVFAGIYNFLIAADDDDGPVADPDMDDAEPVAGDTLDVVGDYLWPNMKPPVEEEADDEDDEDADDDKPKPMKQSPRPDVAPAETSDDEPEAASTSDSHQQTSEKATTQSPTSKPSASDVKMHSPKVENIETE